MEASAVNMRSLIAILLADMILYQSSWRHTYPYPCLPCCLRPLSFSTLDIVRLGSGLVGLTSPQGADKGQGRKRGHWAHALLLGFCYMAWHRSRAAKVRTSFSPFVPCASTPLCFYTFAGRTTVSDNDPIDFLGLLPTLDLLPFPPELLLGITHADWSCLHTSIPAHLCPLPPGSQEHRGKHRWGRARGSP